MKQFLVFAFLCLSTISYAQRDFRKGFVITLSNDTLMGLVNYKEGSKIYEACQFRELKDANTQTYTPTDIRGYGFINGAFFESRMIVTKDKVNTTREFIEVIVDGKVSLYKGSSHFFAEKDSLYPLTNESKVINLGDKQLLQKSNQHIATLNMLLFDCNGNKFKSRIKRVRLEHRLLTNLIEDYNKCAGAPFTTYKAKKPWFKGFIGLASGIHHSSLEEKNLLGSFEKSTAPIVGISLDAFSPRISERFSFHADILYGNSIYYYYSKTQSGSSSRINYVTIDLEQLKVPIGICYTFPQRLLTPYLRAGISGTLYLNSSYESVQEVEINNVVETHKNKILDMQENHVGYWGGFGVLKSLNNKFSGFLELRYENVSGLVENSLTSPNAQNSQISNLQFIIGIRTK